MDGVKQVISKMKNTNHSEAQEKTRTDRVRSKELKH